MELKDYQNWKKLGITFSHGSSEAIKYFGITIYQLITWKEDLELGGIDGTISAMLTSDSFFCMGHILKNVISFLGTSSNPVLNLDFRKSLDECYRIAETLEKTLNDWETLHLKALKCLDEGRMSKACIIWDKILLQYPKDILSIKFAHDTYFYLGKNYSIRDSICRILPSWKPDMPYYGYIMGMYSFGLCETEDYLGAQKYANIGLGINPNDAWSTHTLAHVYEMSDQYDQGAYFLESTKNDWKNCDMLSCHLYWHLALYCISSGNSALAVQLFDDHIISRASSSGSMLDIVDACSILFRLQLHGVDLDQRWQKIYDITSSHTKDHVLTFNDLHFLMSYLGSGNIHIADLFVKDMESISVCSTSENSEILNKVGLTLAKSLSDFHIKNYSNVVEQLWPIKVDVRCIGGSNAQRDVFNQLLISSAKKSDVGWHQNIAIALKNEKLQLHMNAISMLSKT